ncbi:CoA-transferase family III [Jaminaea rosea]|uniref:CoA-transferase family III n=1 Tax=Jaminaea rosea TaxID=1569628 RepID=A0A316ULL5_9BASI|nr:CoA-transferase family III [Jaminaea rosea]PWN25271.1 CoA-transferase family III [Jaminaea rosea]
MAARASRLAPLHRPPLCRRLATTTSSSPPPASDAAGPLAGIRILEMGQLIAGPYCGQLLAHFGADVIKLEPPGVGDPLRVWRELDPEDGVSPWFRSLARNKRSVTCDLRQEEGRRIARRLAEGCDVLIENFKPGTLERWGLGPSDLHPVNPSLIFTRISGYGQTGPMREEPGFAAVCEGFGGFRFVNGAVDSSGQLSGAPIRPNISLGDSLAGLHAAFGTVMALLARGKVKPGEKSGQTVDVAIYEAVLSMMEGLIPAYSRTGAIRGPSGAGVTGIVPTSAFPTSEPSQHVIIGGNGDSIYARLMTAIGRQDLVGERYANNSARVAHQAEIEGAISEWTSRYTVDEVLATMREARVPAGRINDVAHLVADPHVQARGMVERVPFYSERLGKGWEIDMPGVSPVLERGGQGTRWAGKDLGEDNEAMLGGELGVSQEEMQALREKGVI